MKPWTRPETLRLVDLFKGKGKSMLQCGMILGRTEHAIEIKLRKMMLIMAAKKKRTMHELRDHLKRREKRMREA